MLQRTAKLLSPSGAWSEPLLHLSLALLPYGSVLAGLGTVGLLVITVALLVWGRTVDRGQTRWLLGLTGLLLLSCSLAQNRGEAFLQLANYLPLFGFFLAVQLLWHRGAQLTRLALTVVLSSLPLSCLGLLEFAVKLLRKLPGSDLTSALSWFRWVDTTEPHRSMSLFDHPNWFASYLILVLGLGLGLVLHRHPSRFAVQLATLCSLLGICASGSRNAIATAVLQVLVFGIWRLGQKRVWILGGLGLPLLGIGLALLGHQGGRFSLQVLSRDPRFGVWQIALSLIPDHPWLGWGLGAYKFLYPSRRIDPEYPYIAHPHNFWLMLAVETGIPLMLLLTLFVGQIVYGATRRLAKVGLPTAEIAMLRGYLLSFGGCCCFALFDVALFDIRSNVLGWLTLAALSWWGKQEDHRWAEQKHDAQQLP